MSLFYVERQLWQRWPETLVMVKKNGHGDERRRYVPERTCRDFGGEKGTNGEGYDFACSACGFCCDQPQPNYCPNCGARVKEGE